ncbi:MAG: DUF2298 domain-containing protein [Chloroflexi bacterium]|nr:DUF2298 domain-containing protein [Chloroflexota bacterium]
MADAEIGVQVDAARPVRQTLLYWLNRLALPLLLAAALAFRLYGIDWDGGNLYHPDERAILTHTYDLGLPALDNLAVLFDADESPLNPRWFPYGTLPIYALKALQVALSPIVDLDIVELGKVGRVLSALADTVTVAVVYRLGLLLFSRRVGLLAAGLTALAVLHIQLSHFFAAETFQTLFIVSSLYFMVQIVRRGRPRDSLFAGLFVGLAMATKVSSAPILLPLGLAHVFAAWRHAPVYAVPFDVPAAWWRMALASAASVAVAAAAFIITEPYALLDYGRYLSDVMEQSEVVRRIRDYPYTRQYVDTVPFVYHAWQLALFGLGPPLGLVAMAGLAWAGVKVLWRGGAELTLLLAWLVPLLIITGLLEVKFLRYLLPATPLAILLGAAMLFQGLDWLRERAPSLTRWAAAAIAVVVATTALYALSFAAIYAVPHPADRASDWLNANAPEGSLMLKEHWEEGLRSLESYQHRELPMYNADTPGKIAQVATDLFEGDYLLFYSSRLFGTIPRLPDDYPIPYGMTREFYPMLFAGELGYELVRVEQKYPSLLGVSLVNDVYGRAGLAPPDGIDAFAPEGFRVHMGFADESFSVYDHPQVLIFENTGNRNAAQLMGLLAKAARDAPPAFDPMLVSDAEWDRQQSGGTLGDITPPDGIGAQWPLPVWLLAVYAGTIVALPLGLVVFRALPDRGYLLARPLGFLLLAYVPWLLASLGWIGFGRVSIALGFLLLAAVSGWLAYRFRESLWFFVRRRWRLLLAEEALFLTAFLAFVLVRAANPDLWHPYLGGEKPMDFAYLNAVLRSTTMPPLDPWFAGGALNYYYFGQFMVATVIRVTGIPSAVAYNLAVPLFFALTAGAAFSLGYNLTEGARRWLRRTLRPPAWTAVAAGVGAMTMAVVLGNLHGGWQLLRGAVSTFDFWAPTRMMPPDPPGFEITEFPFFTFLFADLHAHLMAMPLALLAVGLCLNTVLLSRRRVARWRLPVSIALLALTAGALAVTNTWDFPTYLALGAVSIAVGQWLSVRRISRALLYKMAGLLLIFAVLAFAFWLPFHLRLVNGFPGIGIAPATTPLEQYLAIHGLFMYIAVTLLAVEALPRIWRWMARRQGPWQLVLGLTVSVLVSLGIALAVVGYGTAAILGALLLAMVVPLLGWLFLRRWRWAHDAAGVRGAAPYHLLPLGLLAVAIAIGVAVDVLVLKGDIDRQNTVFKLYLQAWIFFSLAGAYALWHLGFVRGWFTRPRLSAGVWTAGLLVLLAAAAVYPVLGTGARLDNRFAPTSLTLDGTAYMENAVYFDQAETHLKYDLDAINWLRDNLDGTPVVLDGRTPLYRWGSRVSVYTGLPTVLGWDWHQTQQRCGLDPCPAVHDRAAAVIRIYAGADEAESLDLLDQYGVDYVYVGQTEWQYYPADGLAKFEGMAERGEMSVAYENPEVTIYRVEA